MSLWLIYHLLFFFLILFCCLQFSHFCALILSTVTQVSSISSVSVLGQLLALSRTWRLFTLCCSTSHNSLPFFACCFSFYQCYMSHETLEIQAHCLAACLRAFLAISSHPKAHIPSSSFASSQAQPETEPQACTGVCRAGWSPHKSKRQFFRRIIPKFRAQPFSLKELLTKAKLS